MQQLTLVCVTGASGFLGTHVVKQLLESGKYFVHATVRDVKDQKKVGHLMEMVPGSAQRLKLFSADLLQPAAYDEAIRGCKFVFHVAASVTFSANDPQREIVDVGVKGTQNVFESVERSKDTVKRVVMTSSIAAVGRSGQPNDTVFTEKDWNTTVTLESDPYSLEKVLSEKLSLDLVKDKPYDVVHIHPGLLLGAVFTETHLRTSPTIVNDLATGKFPLAPRLSFPTVHVSDVALAHIIAAERFDPQGPPQERGLNYIPGNSRFLMTLPKSFWLIEFCQVMRQLFPHFTSVPTRQFWNWVMYLVPLFDKRVTRQFLKEKLDKIEHYDNSKAVTELGIEFSSLESCLKDTLDSLIQRKFLPGPPQL